MRVIVCGGCAVGDKDSTFSALDKLHAEKPIAVIVHGGTHGADALAGQWAEARAIAVEVFAPNWKRFGRSGAVHKRNQQMVDAGADLCVAFPGGRGTADVIKRAQAAAIKVVTLGRG